MCHVQNPPLPLTPVYHKPPLPPPKGKYELAGLVQYIPLPVVGGYLAYVGFFCLVAGASVSINMPLHSLSDIQAVVKSTDALYMLSAAVASMAVILFAIERFTHPAALPIALVSVPIAFYGGLWVVGCTLGDAQEAGWVIKPVCVLIIILITLIIMRVLKGVWWGGNCVMQTSL